MAKARATRSKTLTALVEARNRLPGSDDPDAFDEPRVETAPDADADETLPATRSAMTKGRRRTLALKADLRPELSEGRYASRQAYDDDDDDDARSDPDRIDPDAPFDEADIEGNMDALFGLLEGKKKGAKKGSTSSKKKRIRREDAEEEHADIEIGYPSVAESLAGQVARLSQLQKQSITVRDDGGGGLPTTTQEDAALWSAMALLRVRFQPCLVTATRLPLGPSTAEATAAQQTQLKRFAAHLPTPATARGEHNALSTAVAALYAQQGLEMPPFDASYWLQRSQKNRGRVVAVGSARGVPLLEHDPTLYNDDDLYTHLAMQISRDNVSAGAVEPISTRRAGAEVSDRRRSKGRKLQMDPHPKLVNFKQMPLTVVTPSAELLSSLFK